MEKEPIKQGTPEEVYQGHFDPDLASDIHNIPEKISFKIGEVADMLNVKTHVLRYWEMEFDSFHPQKMPNGQRLYFKKDVETALLIKKLLYKDGFSVKGAKKALVDLKRENRQYRKRTSSEDKILKKITQIQETVSVMRELIK